MIVRVYDDDGAFRCECDLHECFPDDSRDDASVSEFVLAFAELRRSGLTWVGGGASPLVLLVRAD